MSNVLIRDRDCLLGQKLVQYFTEKGWNIIKQSPFGNDEKIDLVICNNETHYESYRNFMKMFNTRKEYSTAKLILLSTSKLYSPTPDTWRYGNTRIVSDYDIRCDEFSHIPKAYLYGFRDSDTIISQKYINLGMIDKLTEDWGSRRYIFRLGCIVGYDVEKAKGFLSNIVKCSMKNERFTMYGYDGKQIRDQLHWRDLCRAIVMLYNTQPKENVFNIGGGMENSLSPIEAVSLVNKFRFFKNFDYSDEVKDNKPVYITNYNKATKEFGWKPEIGLEEIVKGMIEDYKK